MSGALWNLGSLTERLRDELAQEWLTGDEIAMEAITTLSFGSSEAENFTTHPALQIAASLDTFITEAVEMDGGYMDYFRALWSNRSRCRRTMCHVVKGFYILERSSAQFDNVLQER